MARSMAGVLEHMSWPCSPGRFSLAAVSIHQLKGYGDSQKGELTQRLGVTGVHLGTDVNFRLKQRRD